MSPMDDSMLRNACGGETMGSKIAQDVAADPLNQTITNRESERERPLDPAAGEAANRSIRGVPGDSS